MTQPDGRARAGAPGRGGAGGQADAALRADLARRLELLAELGPRAQPAEIAGTVESVMATVEGDLSAVNLKLYAEIEALSRYIANAKAEIVQLRPDEIRTEHLPSATDELAAIVGATEQATNTIFEAVEGIEEVAQTLDPETGQKITDHVTQVYEACSFQDITGQRISKVVTTLQQIETKVDALLTAFGEKAAEAQRRKREGDPNTEPGADPDKGLMNGPAAPGEETVSQADIDALLASFD